MFKKKFHGGLKVLLLLLFIMSLGIFSTCYASNQLDFIDVSFWEQVENHFLSLSTVNTNVKNFLNNSFVNPTNLQNAFETKKNDFLSYMNQNNLEDRNFVLMVSATSSKLMFILIPNNNSIGNSADFMYVLKDTTYLYIKTDVFNPNCLALTYFNGNITASVNSLTSFRDGTLSGGYSDYPGVTRNSIKLNTDNSNFVIIPNLLGLNAQSINIVEWLNTTSSTPEPKFLEYYIDFTTQVIPDVPSGESSGDSLPSGTITNPSGDVTGRVDLSNIENGITNINQNLNNIENKIPSSGEIISANIASNKNYWGTSGDLNGEDQEELIEDSFNQVFNSLSGDLHSNPVFGFLESGEDIFLNFFKNQQDESYYDLIISWNDINLFGSKLVDKGSINISQLCRDVPELGNVQQLIRIIFNFGCLVALLWQIYNLVLSTLGIDNPYLYEDAHVTDVINSDTGEIRSYYRRSKRIFKRW